MGKTRELITKANHIFDSVLEGSALLAKVIIILQLIGVLVDIFMRYFLNKPIPWMLEVTSFGLLWIAFLGIAWLLKKEGHVKMELVTNRLNPRAQTIMNIITSIMCVAVCVILTWSIVGNTAHYIQIAHVQPSERRFPTSPIFIIIPIGFFLLFIQSLRRTNGYLKIWRGLHQEQDKGCK